MSIRMSISGTIARKHAWHQPVLCLGKHAWHQPMLCFLCVVSIFISACQEPQKPEPEVSADDSAMFEALKHRFGRDDPGQFVRIYPFKRGVFTFDIRGMGVQKGQLVMIVDEYGHFESKNSEKVDSTGARISNWTIKRGMDLWSLDENLREATLVIMETREPSGVDFEALIAARGSIEAAETFLRENKLEILPDEEVSGFTCQVVKQDMEKFSLLRWIHKGVDLRMAVEFPDARMEITRELISAEFDTEVSGSAFEIPGEYSVSTTLIKTD